MEPNFLIGGAAAAGTSFLSSLLMQHPDIYLPAQMRPEPHYFYKSWEYKKPISYYLDTYFSAVTTQKAVGERSSSYLYMQDVAPRVHAIYPDMRWIFTLRNPVERTFANYRYTVLEGFEDLSFEDALEQEPQRMQAEEGRFQEIQPHDYTGRGFYGRQMQHFLQYFPRSAILCLKSESLRHDLNEQLLSVCSFLGVALHFSHTIPPVFSSPSVQDPRIQKQCRDHFTDRFDTVVEYIRIHQDVPPFSDPLDKEAAQALRHNFTTQSIEMIPETRAYLRDVFAEDMDTLRGLVNFSIEDWK